MPTLFRSCCALLLLAGLSAPVSVQAQFSEGFGDITTLEPGGWVLRNNSEPLGVSNWFQGNAGIFPARSGAPDSYIAANFDNTGEVGTISNWLVTPVLSLTNGSTFSFFAQSAGTDFPDRLELRLSTLTGGNVGTGAEEVGDFDRLLLSINPDLVANGFPNAWTQYSVTLSGLAAPAEGRFAFRYFVTEAGLFGRNGDYIGIDDVSYAVSTVPEPGTWALMTAGLLALGVAARRRVRAG